MKTTLQDQYLLIKEGKGHKGVFLADAKRQFPNIVRNAATFEEASSCLITKNIIAENVIGLTAVNSPFEPKKKESYEIAFENFLVEAAKAKKVEDEKAELKATSKQVEKDLEKNFNYEDNKNPDNLIFDQIMMGYYAEMKDPKNADKTMQDLKDIVLKNLAKDPIFYTKDGQFGVKGLGYTTEAPGLGEPKEPKGKYKSSGYGDLNEGIIKEELKRSNSGAEYIKINGKTVRTYTQNGDKSFNVVYDDGTKDTIMVNHNSWDDINGLHNAYELEESKLRKVIREIIGNELSVLPKTSLKESIEKELAAINKEAEHEIIASKLEKVQTLIDKKQTQISRLDEDEDLKDLTDAKKVKEISKDIKSLEKAKAKLEKMMHKGKAKASRKEVIDETDEIIDEADTQPTKEYLAAKEDAEQRYDKGEEIDSIMSNYTNLSDKDQKILFDDLKGKMNGMEN